MVLPIKRKNCCEKKTRVISCRVDWVWHLRSRMVGPRNATHSPKLKNTLQYVKVCCQLLRNKAQIRSLSRCFILEKVSEVFLQHLHSYAWVNLSKVRVACSEWSEWWLSDSRMNDSFKSVLLKDPVKPTRLWRLVGKKILVMFSLRRVTDVWSVCFGESLRKYFGNDDIVKPAFRHKIKTAIFETIYTIYIHLTTSI